MGTSKQSKKQAGTDEVQTVSTTWRTPISLSEFETEDPLENLYKGREAGDGDKLDIIEDKPIQEPKVKTSPTADKSAKVREKKIIEAKTKSETSKPKIQEKKSIDDFDVKTAANPIVVEILTEADLKKVLKIKSEFFRFTDIREILRGKSFDIYSYLILLAGDEGICKIKHLDLMDKLEISRPTLFKQEEWLVKLRLIEKRNVPGDHLGTSYTVNRLEDVLPVPKILVKQLNANVESLHKSEV